MRKKFEGNRKIAIVGSGYVGSSIAYALTLRDIAREIVLIDIDEEKTRGEALDIRHGIPSMGTADLYQGSYSDCADCDMIIVTAGRSRKPGETRLDMTNENVKILEGVAVRIKEHYTRGVVLIISNPVDIMTYKVAEWMGLPDGYVFGTGCMLDSSRFIRCIADYVGLSTGVVNGYVIGEHGDGQIPVWSKVTVGGIPIDEFCEDVKLEWNREVREEIENNTKAMGAEIIKAKGRTHYGIATCVCYIADAVINQRPTILSVSSTLQGEYGFSNVALSVPSVVGPAGVQQRIREKWSVVEYERFVETVDKIKKVQGLIEA